MLWLDRTRLALALRIAGGLDEAGVDAALDNLQRLRSSIDVCGAADPANHLALWCVLEGRRLQRQGINAAGFERAQHRMRQLLWRLEALPRRDADWRATFESAVHSWLAPQFAHLFARTDADVVDGWLRLLFNIERLFRLKVCCDTPASLRTDQRADRADGLALDLPAGLWRLHVAARQPDVASVEALSALSDAATGFSVDERQRARLSARHASRLALALALTPETRATTETTAGKLDVIAAPFADDAVIQRERAEAWCYVAFARSQMPEARADTEAAARVVDAIAARFPQHAEIQQEREQAWGFVPVSGAEQSSRMPFKVW